MEVKPCHVLWDFRFSISEFQFTISDVREMSETENSSSCIRGEYCWVPVISAGRAKPGTDLRPTDISQLSDRVGLPLSQPDLHSTHRNQRIRRFGINIGRLEFSQPNTSSKPVSWSSWAKNTLTGPSSLIRVDPGTVGVLYSWSSNLTSVWWKIQTMWFSIDSGHMWWNSDRMASKTGW